MQCKPGAKRHAVQTKPIPSGTNDRYLNANNFSAAKSEMAYHNHFVLNSLGGNPVTQSLQCLSLPIPPVNPGTQRSYVWCPRNHGRRRMTRGRDDSLGLSRTTRSFATLRRFKRRTWCPRNPRSYSERAMFLSISIMPSATSCILAIRKSFLNGSRPIEIALSRSLSTARQARK